MIDTHESGENYLESILILKLQKNGGKVRSVDIANFFGFSKPSVSRAVKLLIESGDITSTEEGLNLTEQGLKHAEEIYEKHRTIKSYFMRILNVSEEIAEKDACRIEHIISSETFEKIKAALNQ